MVGHTSLGEEGGESMVIVGALALLGEVTIRLYTTSVYSPHNAVFDRSHLNAVLEAVQL